MATNLGWPTPASPRSTLTGPHYDQVRMELAKRVPIAYPDVAAAIEAIGGDLENPDADVLVEVGAVLLGELTALAQQLAEARAAATPEDGTWETWKGWIVGGKFQRWISGTSAQPTHQKRVYHYEGPVEPIPVLGSPPIMMQEHQE
jgi:hypothetical protein